MALNSIKQNSQKEPEKTDEMAVIQGMKVTPQTAQEISQPPVLHREQMTRNKDFHLASQIPLDSYLGQTLNNSKRLGTSKCWSKDNSSSPSSSSSSSDSSLIRTLNLGMIIQIKIPIIANRILIPKERKNLNLNTLANQG